MSEYRKSEEVTALRREGEKITVERNQALAQVQRLEHENRILKRAVVIQVHLPCIHFDLELLLTHWMW